MPKSQFDCFSLTKSISQISDELSIPHRQVKNAVQLFEDGNTIPFIARYRKEATKGLDEISLRLIQDALEKSRELASRKTTILKTIHSAGQLSEELKTTILECFDKQQLEVLYLPYKPKRRTRATTAREQGLEPLADFLLAQANVTQSRDELLASFIDENNGVSNDESALAGACDIVAEAWSEELETRSWMLDQATQFGFIESKVKRGKKEVGKKFEMYFAHRESTKRIPSHRLLGMKRGEAEGFLNVSLSLDDEITLRKLKQRLLKNQNFEFHNDLTRTVEDCYKRLLLPATESTILQQLKDEADEEASNVFARNLGELLLSPPAGPHVTLGIDPGFRTGCKLAVVDETGKFLANETIYPTAPKNDTIGSSVKLMELINKYDIQLIAIGNGTASRETDSFVSHFLKSKKLDITKVVVSESGASIYSASELAVHEYPNLDVTVRGAISIAHRLQDPLAELVKIDPKSIGVGQYQHDVNQALLKKSLNRQVESCVNSVGVDLNMASPSLLAHVAGIGPKLAENIVEYRNEHGAFESRKQLLNVNKLGKKAFQQAAGFLRIRNARNPLDNSAVHPESYYIVEKMADKIGASSRKLVGNESLVKQLCPEDFIDDQFGLLTIKDIIDELAKPGRDPRRKFRVAKFNDAVNSIQDLNSGMILEGTVTNVTNFGCFVDLGVHQDGLVHISELSNEFVEDPNSVVSIGDIVKVKVLEVDVERKRIGLSRKQARN